ncbi:uncharacterized protein MONBRDRAFT_11179 [Monosiga brevicollis MX1]|uniref:SH2 domain-containing protein n=1 Tax=Monosiga brevicollis TaxID=81824 RepID=A9V8F5_MONBE|nr:uncharacterized protein MONBRDRAFT_11179 [Monosiga brevicollis MX1]EDQ86136.1 predicted protein [Monosiga brevicollis MX1]|eukprot:XP_001749061.1 hypothetical protein [Monosiga brevicollis MX1]
MLAPALLDPVPYFDDPANFLFFAGRSRESNKRSVTLPPDLAAGVVSLDIILRMDSTNWMSLGGSCDQNIRALLTVGRDSLRDKQAGLVVSGDGACWDKIASSGFGSDVALAVSTRPLAAPNTTEMALTLHWALDLTDLSTLDFRIGGSVTLAENSSIAMGNLRLYGCFNADKEACGDALPLSVPVPITTTTTSSTSTTTTTTTTTTSTTSTTTTTTTTTTSTTSTTSTTTTSTTSTSSTVSTTSTSLSTSTPPRFANPPTAPSSMASSSKKTDLGLIVGLVMGVLLLGLLLAVMLIAHRRRRAERRTNPSYTPDVPDEYLCQNPLYGQQHGPEPDPDVLPPDYGVARDIGPTSSKPRPAGYNQATLTLPPGPDIGNYEAMPCDGPAFATHNTIGPGSAASPHVVVHGDMGRQEAESLLVQEVRPDGHAFLLRRRPDGSLAMTVAHAGRPRHHLLRWSPDDQGWFVNDTLVAPCARLDQLIARLQQAGATGGLAYNLGPMLERDTTV